MAQTLSQFLGRFTINALSDSFSVGATAKTLTNRTTYYLTGYTGEATTQLCEAVQAKCVEEDATATCVYSATTGRVTITFADTTAVTWTDAALGTILGYTGNLSGAASYVATNPPRYVWRPTRGGLMPHYQSGINFWDLASTSLVYRSPDGSSHGVQGSVIYDGTAEFRLLPVEDILTPITGTTYRDFQQFFQDVIHVTQPVRFYPDRSLSLSTSFVTALVGRPGDEAIGSLSKFMSRHISAFNGLWNIAIPMMKYDGA